MKKDYVLQHLSWIEHGLDYRDALSLRQRIKASTGLERIHPDMLQQHLGYGDPDLARHTDTPMQNLTFLILDDPEFDGNLAFLKEAYNLHTLYISGSHSKKKISSIEVLGNLKSLKRVVLNHQQISDLEPLAAHLELEELDLEGNPVNSITPLSGHRNIQKAKFSGIKETEVVPLLQNSRAAIVTNEGAARYFAFWVNKWAFKGRFFVINDRVEVSLEPVTGQEVKDLQVTAPQNLRGLVLRSREIAKGIVNKKLKIQDSKFTYHETTNSITGQFNFK